MNYSSVEECAREFMEKYSGSLSDAKIAERVCKEMGSKTTANSIRWYRSNPKGSKKTLNRVRVKAIPKSLFKMPDRYTITGRSSSITAATWKSIMPVVKPNIDEFEKVLQVLGMSRDKIFCAYCGDKWTLWDHFEPVVEDKKFTGYITEIHNLVPCCSPCNSSKGNSHWRNWISGGAKQSPATREVCDLGGRIKSLERFEKLNRIKIEIPNDIVKEMEILWSNVSIVLSALPNLQEEANVIKKNLENLVKT